MVSYPGKFSKIQGEKAFIACYPDKKFTTLTCPLNKIEYFMPDPGQEELIYPKDSLNSDTKFVITEFKSSNKVQVMSFNPCIFYGKISSYDNNTNKIMLMKFDNSLLCECNGNFVFTMDDNNFLEDINNLIERPVEIIWYKGMCIQIKILDPIPIKFNAVVCGTRDQYILLKESQVKEKFIYVMHTECFTGKDTTPLPLDTIYTYEGKTVEIKIFFGACRVEFLREDITKNSSDSATNELIISRVSGSSEKLIKAQISHKFEYKNRIAKANCERVPISNLIPQTNSKDNISEWYRHDTESLSLKLTITIGLLELVPKELSLYNAISNLLSNNQPYQELLETIKFSMQSDNAAKYSKYFELLENNNELILSISDMIVRPISDKIDYQGLCDSLEVCIKVYEVMENRIFTSFYVPDNYHKPCFFVMHLLIVNQWNWIIYSPFHMEQDGLFNNQNYQNFKVDKKYEKWPVVYHNPSILKKEYLALFSTLPELNNIIIESINPKNKSDYIDKIKTLVDKTTKTKMLLNEDQIQSLDSIVEVIKFGINSEVEIQSKMSTLCSHCSKKEGKYNICCNANCSKFCDVCAIKSIRDDKCLTCKNKVLKLDIITECKHCRQAFTFNNGNVFECECYYCHDCYTRISYNIPKPSKCNKCNPPFVAFNSSKSSENSSEYPHLARLGPQENTCKCTKDKGVKKICNKCGDLCVKCIFKSRKLNKCIYCYFKLENRQTEMNIVCPYCENSYHISYCMQMVCDCVVCNSCYPNIKNAQQNPKKMCKICNKIAYYY
jgi:predicted translin family RNA/ssDNA-binding protein